jgi:hypothetical protein
VNFRKTFSSGTAVCATRDPQWVPKTRNERPPVNVDGYLQDCEDFFDNYASTVDTWHRRNRGYHVAVASLARFNVPENVSVLELGSRTGVACSDAASPRSGHRHLWRDGAACAAKTSEFGIPSRFGRASQSEWGEVRLYYPLKLHCLSL